jgi:hypothetical protein
VWLQVEEEERERETVPCLLSQYLLTLFPPPSSFLPLPSPPQVLLEFLGMIQQRKEEAVKKVAQDLEDLDTDIQEVREEGRAEGEKGRVGRQVGREREGQRERGDRGQG